MTDRKIGALLLGFGLTTFGAMVLTNVPDIGETNADAVTFYASSAGPARTFVALYLTVAAAVSLLFLVSRLLVDLGAEAARVRTVCLAAAAGYATLSIAAATAFSTPTVVFRLDSSYEGPIDPEFARTMSSVGDGLLLVAAPLMLAVCLAALSRSTRGLLPAWVRRATTALAVTLLFGWTWFPLLLVVLWALVVGTALAVRGTAPLPALTSAVAS